MIRKVVGFALFSIMVVFMCSCKPEAEAMSNRSTTQYTVIDVRTPEEYAGGHLAGARLMPHTQIGALIADKVPDKATPIKVYCRTGRRAETARQALNALGYQDVENLGSLTEAQYKLKLEMAK